MSGFQQKAITFIGAIVSVVFMLLPISVLTQPQTTVTQIDQTNRVSIAYIAAKDPVLQEFYSLLAQRHALEKIREILGPFRLPEELTIKTAECGVINSWYKRENFKPTVTVCYEYLRHILESLPNETTPAGVTPADAAVGQFFWVTFHEIGHAIFDIFDVPIFGHPEDARRQFCSVHAAAIRQGAGAAIDRGCRLGLESVSGRLQEESCGAEADNRFCK
jgi:hypothetical protein